MREIVMSLMCAGLVYILIVWSVDAFIEGYNALRADREDRKHEQRKL